jgi:hypothetical protein
MRIMAVLNVDHGRLDADHGCLDAYHGRFDADYGRLMRIMTVLMWILNHLGSYHTVIRIV